MKVVARVLCVLTIGFMIAGCASKTAYVPNIPVKAQAQILDYMEKPGNKIFVIAVDPNGEFAYGSDYGKATVKEAAKLAVEQCDAGRKAFGIGAPATVYAINNDVVYEQMLQKAKDAVAPAEEAPVEEAPAEEAPAEEVPAEEAPAEEAAE